MAYLDNSVEYGFGQLGSAYLTIADTDFTPPSGLVVVAITVIEACEFSAKHTFEDRTHATAIAPS